MEVKVVLGRQATRVAVSRNALVLFDFDSTPSEVAPIILAGERTPFSL